MTAQTGADRKNWDQGGPREAVTEPALEVPDLRTRHLSIHCAAPSAVRPLVLAEAAARGLPLPEAAEGLVAAAATSSAGAGAEVDAEALLLALGGGETLAASLGWQNGHAAHLGEGGGEGTRKNWGWIDVYNYMVKDQQVGQHTGVSERQRRAPEKPKDREDIKDRLPAYGGDNCRRNKQPDHRAEVEPAPDEGDGPGARGCGDVADLR